MKSVTAFVGSAHKGGATHTAARLLLDRLGFVYHRPQFFGRTFTSIVVQGIHGGGKVVKYLDYFYPTRLGPLKKAAGAAFDWVADRQYRPKAES